MQIKDCRQGRRRWQMNRISEQVTGWLVTAVLAAFTTVAGADADRMRDWQISMLFNPNEHQLEVEDKGRVMIYDGLYSAEVNQAMEQQFDRIEHMMFTNTIMTDEAGKPLRDPKTGLVMVEEDGCE
jgi:hypothetical protein